MKKFSPASNVEIFLTPNQTCFGKLQFVWIFCFHETEVYFIYSFPWPNQSYFYSYTLPNGNDRCLEKKQIDR